MTEVARYTFHISSSQKTSAGTLTDFNIQLSQVITRLAKNSQFSVIVHGITIPFSFYQLSSDIGTVTVSTTGNADGTISLTPGNYTTISVLTELSTQLTAFCQSRAVPFTPTFNFTYSILTGKTTLAMTAPALKTITIKFGSNTNLGLFFGFSTDAIISTLLSPTGDKIAVANPVNYLLLRSPTLKQFGNREWITERDAYSDIIYRVPIETNVGTYIQWYGDQEPFIIINDTLSLINFYLTSNLSYTAIDLQGLPFAFHVTISERLQPEYEPIMNTALPKMITEIKPNVEELDALKKERDDALRRLDTYKRKLLPKEKDVVQK